MDIFGLIFVRLITSPIWFVPVSILILSIGVVIGTIIDGIIDLFEKDE